MSSRNWKNWPKNAYSSLSQAGGFLGIAGIVVSVVGVAASAPVAIVVGVATIGVTSGYALIAGYTEKLIDPNMHVGKKITLKEVLNLSEDILQIGIFGASSSGKSTFLEHAITSDKIVPVTHDISATIVSLQTNPPKKIALLDGDGKNLSQQFKVVKHADTLFVFLDHNAGSSEKVILKERLYKHEEYLKQLQEYLKEEVVDIFKQIHFVLNKRDLWEDSSDKQMLLDWFNQIVNNWTTSNFSKKVTSSHHSNIYTHDINILMNIIISIR